MKHCPRFLQENEAPTMNRIIGGIHMGISGDRLVPVKIGNQIDVLTLSELYGIQNASVLSVNLNDPCPQLEIGSLPTWWVKRFLNNKSGEAYAADRKGRGWQVAKKRINSMIKRSKGEEVAAEWLPIMDITRRVYNDEILDVSSRFGGTTCSKEFPLMSWEGNVLKPKKASDINLYKPASVTCPVSSPTDIKYDVPIQCDDVRNGLCYWPNPKGAPYRLPTKIDYTNQSLAKAWFRILGEYVSEGYSSSKLVAITGTSKEAMEKTASDMSLLLGREILAKPRQNEFYHGCIRGRHVFARSDTIYRVSACNGPIANMFAGICGRGAKNKKIPSCVFNAPPYLKEEFLKALCRGDAYNFDKNKSEFEKSYTEWYKQVAFRFETASVRLACGVCLLLATMDKRFSIRRDLVKQSYGVDYVAYRKNSRNPKIRIIPTSPPTDGYLYDVKTRKGFGFVDAMGLLVIGDKK